MNNLVGKALGFIMAHSALIGSSLEKGQLMVPYIVIEKDGHRTSTEFEADTQGEAVEKASNAFKKLMLNSDLIAFAQEGLVTLESGEKQDVYFFKVWTHGMNEPLEAYQMFNPIPFSLVGNVQILNFPESGLDLDKAEEFAENLNVGIESHRTAGALWMGWFTNN